MSSRTLTRRRSILAYVDDYVALTKPRVMSLLLLTTFAAMVLAGGEMPSASLIAAVLMGGAFASGGASAINNSIEPDIDAAMRRTDGRPVAAGRVSPQAAFVFGVSLNVASFVVILLGANLLAAGLAILGTLIYVIVYTLWLKRTTTQNIVIGGAAGAVPPLVGWAAVTGGLTLPAWYLFAIIFFWTPPHFWALAILIRDDYKAAGVPMLPVVAGFEQTRVSILLYTILLVALTALLYIASPLLGYLYLLGALGLGAAYVFMSARLWWNPSRPATAALYKYSLFYLAALFLLIMVDGSIA